MLDENCKADVHSKIEQLLIEKQKYIDGQLSNFNIFEQTSGGELSWNDFQKQYKENV